MSGPFKYGTAVSPTRPSQSTGINKNLKWSTPNSRKLACTGCLGLSDWHNIGLSLVCLSSFEGQMGNFKRKSKQNSTKLNNRPGKLVMEIMLPWIRSLMTKCGVGGENCLWWWCQKKALVVCNIFCICNVKKLTVLITLLAIIIALSLETILILPWLYCTSMFSLRFKSFLWCQRFCAIFFTATILLILSLLHFQCLVMDIWICSKLFSLLTAT